MDLDAGFWDLVGAAELDEGLCSGDCPESEDCWPMICLSTSGLNHELPITSISVAIITINKRNICENKNRDVLAH
jgi:hypothetical protein